MRLAPRVKATIKVMLRNAGYEIKKHDDDPFVAGGIHEWIHPTATYSPWNRDASFLETYRRIRTETLVDEYRCFELWRLVEQSAKAEGYLIEVGVWRGGTGALIARRAQLTGITDPVYLCDTFSGVVKASDKDPMYRGGECGDTSKRTVQRLIDALSLTNVTILKGIFPEQTAHMIRHGKCRFCHIDVDVYQSAKDVVDWIWPRMAVGGIVVFDDYGLQGCEGVTTYVEEQFYERDRIVLHNLNGHAVVLKTR